jgi:hypothetical protein
VDNKYSPENEFSVKWDTVPGLIEMFQNYIPDFNPKNITISEKDRDGHSYQELEKEVVF